MAGGLPLLLRLRLWLRRMLLKLFPPPFVERPQDLDAYPKNERTILEAILNRWASELKGLQQLGIPVPIQTKPLTITPELTYVYDLRIYYPEYEFPPHLLFCARLSLPSSASPYMTKPESAYYFFSADKATVEEAEALLKEKGLLEVVRTFPGRWYSRDPYLALKPSGCVGIGLTYPMQDIAVPGFLSIYSEGMPPPVEPVPGYSLAELEAIQRRLDLYAAFSTETSPPSLTRLLRYDEKDWKAPSIPDRVLFELPVPLPAFDADTVSLKILPSGDAPQAMMQSFFMGLRSVNSPVSFELIDDGSSAYLQLCCSADDLDLVARQLRLHFPQFTFEEHEEFVTDALPSVSVKPKALYLPVRTLPEFTLDPLGQLFAVLDETPQGEVTAFQVFFFPLQDAALVALLEHLQERSDHTQNAERSARIRQGSQKLPAWQVSVRLLCSNPATLYKLKAGFLGQYQVSGQPLIFTEERALLNVRDMSDWTLLSTPELAAFAHFPTSERLV